MYLCRLQCYCLPQWTLAWIDYGRSGSCSGWCILSHGHGALQGPSREDHQESNFTWLEVLCAHIACAGDKGKVYSSTLFDVGSSFWACLDVQMYTWYLPCMRREFLCFAAFTTWSTCTFSKKEPIVLTKFTHKGWVNMCSSVSCVTIISNMDFWLQGSYYLAKFIGEKCNVYEFLRAVSGEIDSLHCIWRRLQYSL